MPLNVSRLRYWFAASAILAVLVVAGFYFYARYRYYTAIKEIPKKLGVDIQQTTDSFTLSKSEGGHTIFTIRASKAVQYKQGGRAELHDVNIVVYGRESNRFDQIYGSNFEYDPQTGNVVAKGEVNIDLEGNAAGQIAGDQAPPAELKNPIHLKTSGLVFNQKSGLAQTDQRIEFEIPQASGSAIGAKYDSKTNTLMLGSDVKLNTTGTDAASVVATHGSITKDPRRAVFDNARMQRGTAEMAADKVTLFLKEDNSIERVFAQGNVQTKSAGPTTVTARAPVAEVFVAGKNMLQSAVMSGGVVMQATGTERMDGNAGRVLLAFGRDSKLERVHATEGVRLLQVPNETAKTAGGGLVLASARSSSVQARQASSPRPKDQVELTAPALDLYLHDGEVLERAETNGPSQIAIEPQDKSASNSRTVITAAKFTAGFRDNRLSSMHGAPDAKVVQSTAGQPDKVSTSDVLDADFDSAGNITGFAQAGNFHYREAEAAGNKSDRAAWADKATYDNRSQVLTLTGSPRVVEGGMTTTARQIRFNRHSGDAEAQYDVKTTYSELQAQPGGAMLATSDPVHVTAANMVLRRDTNVARYSGSARLWQVSNVIEAPVIVFDRDKRSVDAEGGSGRRVSTVLVQQNQKGTSTPVSIAADRFTYTDKERKARFEGSVFMRSADGTVTANQVDAYLKAREPGGKAAARADRPALPMSAGPSQLERAVAEDGVVVQQPNRRATGNTLVYTARDQKFVLSGGSPSIFDAEHGTVTGDSLTFYSGDDKVLVEGGGQRRSVTTTRVSK
jgi:lipopolysaccharide export system protein LptA